MLATLRNIGVAKVLDLGCGEGRLISVLLEEPSIRSITGLDVSHRALETARKRLRLDTLPMAQRERITLLHGSLTYRDKRLSGYDAAIAMEVVEHIDTPRLDVSRKSYSGPRGRVRPSLRRQTRSTTRCSTGYPLEPSGHRDHRFEWTREQFQDWARHVADRRKYDVRFQGIGPEHLTYGTPTQMGVFTR